MKNTVTHIIIIAVAAIIASVIGTKMYVAQQALFPEKAAMRTMPLAGLHKFSADVNWMLFVNYLGSVGEVNEKNIDEVIRRIEKLLRLDPNQEQYYRNGVMFIANEDPVKALELLKKGCENPNLKKNAEIPFYTGFVLMHNQKPAQYEEAAKYFKMSMERPCDSENSIACNAGRRYDFCLAKVKAAKEKIDFRLAMVEVLFGKLKTREGMDAVSGGTSSIEEQLLNALSSARNSDAEYTPTKQTLDRVNEIAARVFADRHLCTGCLHAYEAGDKFCTSCGNAVKTWGVCRKCNAVIGTAAYCSKCGTKNAK